MPVAHPACHGNQAAVAGGDRHAGVGLGRDEVHRREQQQVDGQEVERHAHASARSRCASAPPPRRRRPRAPGVHGARLFVELESARTPSWANTSPSPDSLIRPSRPKPARTASSPPAMPPCRRDRRHIAAVDDPQVGGRGETDERPDLGAKARHRAEPRAEARHGGLAQRQRERRQRLRRWRARLHRGERARCSCRRRTRRARAGPPGVCGSSVTPGRPTAWSITCARLSRTTLGGALGVLGAHVRVAHQDRRHAAAAPGEDLEAGLVVVVVRALALRHVAPGAGDVAGGEGVLEEVERESLVGQHRPRQRLALGRRERLVGQPRGLLQRAQVEPGVDADGADVGAGLAARARRTRAASCRCSAGAAGSGRCWSRRASRIAGRRAAGACPTCAAR